MYIVIILISVVAWLIATRNGIIKMHHMVKRSWADINGFVKQKYDILEAQVQSIDKYMSHEQSYIDAVTNMRNSMRDLNNDEINPNAIADFEKQSSTITKGFYAVSESYPDIKSNMLFMKNMDEIVSQNENVGASISIFNRNVQQFNSTIDMFPKNIVNNLLCNLVAIDNFSDKTTDMDMNYKPNF